MMIRNVNDCVPSTICEGEIKRDLYLLIESENLATGLTVVYPKSRTRGHSHLDAEEHYFVLEGRGLILLDGESYPIKEGDDILVPPVTIHTVVNTGDTPLKFFWAALTKAEKVLALEEDKSDAK